MSQESFKPKSPVDAIDILEGLSNKNGLPFKPALLNLEEIAFNEIESKFPFQVPSDLREYFLRLGSNERPYKTLQIDGLLFLTDFKWAATHYLGQEEWLEIFDNYDIDPIITEKSILIASDASGTSLFLNLDSESCNFGKILELGNYGYLPEYNYNSLLDFLTIYCEAYTNGVISMKDGKLITDFFKLEELRMIYK